MNRKYPLALFIGRFQPFHKGHLYSLKRASEMAEKVLVGIGSSRKARTKDNPWSYRERKVMVEKVMANLKWERGVGKITGVADDPDDAEWGRRVVALVRREGYEPAEVVAVGNNSWTNRLLREVGMAVYESGLYRRDELEGVKIRELMRTGEKSWRERVPECVRKELGWPIGKNGRLTGNSRIV